jgi:hypothetical protein
MTTDDFCFYFQNRLIQTSQTGGQWYSDTSPYIIPWSQRQQRRKRFMTLTPGSAAPKIAVIALEGFFT